MTLEQAYASCERETERLWMAIELFSERLDAQAQEIELLRETLRSLVKEFHA